MYINSVHKYIHTHITDESNKYLIDHKDRQVDRQTETDRYMDDTDRQTD